jgi:cytochrome c-type biogenesis protein CcmH
MRLAFALLLVGFAMVGPALALRPDEILPNAALEARARAISAELRCLVCQNQSIDDSDAPLARDLRIIVRERLLAGDSDAQVQSFVVARYGEFVLLRPVIAPHTILLWLTAPLVLLIGVAVLVLGARRRRRELATEAVPELSDAEQAALDRLHPAER